MARRTIAAAHLAAPSTPARRHRRPDRGPHRRRRPRRVARRGRRARASARRRPARRPHRHLIRETGHWLTGYAGAECNDRDRVNGDRDAGTGAPTRRRTRAAARLPAATTRRHSLRGVRLDRRAGSGRARRSSALSVGGLVTHLADMERNWTDLIEQVPDDGSGNSAYEDAFRLGADQTSGRGAGALRRRRGAHQPGGGEHLTRCAGADSEGRALVPPGHRRVVGALGGVAPHRGDGSPCRPRRHRSRVGRRSDHVRAHGRRRRLAGHRVAPALAARRPERAETRSTRSATRSGRVTEVGSRPDLPIMDSDVGDSATRDPCAGRTAVATARRRRRRMLVMVVDEVGQVTWLDGAVEALTGYRPTSSSARTSSTTWTPTGIPTRSIRSGRP